MKVSFEDLKSCFDSPCCLCIGAGTTSSFVGSWKNLLGKLLGRRLISSWQNEHKPYNEVETYVDDDCFHKIFSDESNLDVGEFLLSDDVGIGIEESVKVPNDLWQESLLAAQVSDVIRKSTERTLCKVCQKDCTHDDCPLKKPDAHTLADMFCAYQKYGSECSSEKSDTISINDFATAAAVVELCAMGKVTYVVTYNFDTVIEEMLYEAIAEGHLGKSYVKQIHIWTFGDDQKDCSTVFESRSCKILFHQGRYMDPLDDLVKPDSVHFFHVHGVAPSSKMIAHMSDYNERLVLSQHSYEIYQQSTLNWSNLILQYIFSRYNVVAVGFSGTDGNYRSFMLEHINSRMKGLLIPERSKNNKIIFLKAKQSYHKQIEKALTDAQKNAKNLGTNEDLDCKTKKLVSEQVDYFLSCCIDMVTDYYDGHYEADISWVNSYSEIASTLHKIANG